MCNHWRCPAAESSTHLSINVHAKRCSKTSCHSSSSLSTAGIIWTHVAKNLALYPQVPCVNCMRVATFHLDEHCWFGCRIGHILCRSVIFGQMADLILFLRSATLLHLK